MPKLADLTYILRTYYEPYVLGREARTRTCASLLTLRTYYVPITNLTCLAERHGFVVAARELNTQGMLRMSDFSGLVRTRTCICMCMCTPHSRDAAHERLLGFVTESFVIESFVIESIVTAHVLPDTLKCWLAGSPCTCPCLTCVG